MGNTRGRSARWLVVGLVLVVLATAMAAGAAWIRARSRRLDLDEVRLALAESRLGTARVTLNRLVARWPQDSQVLLLQGEYEYRRGRRDDGSVDPQARDSALAAWGRVPASSPDFPLAALAQAPHLIKLGRYAPAEQVLVAALSTPIRDLDVRYELERTLSRVYRFEGRNDDVRRVLRASWGRSFGRMPNPASVLKELWLLDRSPIPAEVLQGELNNADDRDDRVWLGRANHAILTGRFADAAGWLDRALAKRPGDPAIWRAKLALARAAGDVPTARAAAEHLPAGSIDPTALGSLRAWLAARLGRPEDECRELEALLRDDPGDAPALERLAVLTLAAGQAGPSEEFRRRKGEIDRAHDRARKLLLEADPSPFAAELSRLCQALGRGFDSRAWAVLAELGPMRRDQPIPRAILARAEGLSSPFEEGSPPEAGPTLADRLADLRGAEVSPSGSPMPDKASTARVARRFVDEAETAGLRFTFENGQTFRHLLPETMSGGVGVLDYDGDGWLDVYCVQGGALLEPPAPGAGHPPAPGDRLFRNRGDGTFEDVTERSRIAAIAWGRGYGMGVAVGDHDNDGDPDLFITRVDSYALYRNRGWCPKWIERGKSLTYNRFVAMTPIAFAP